MGLSIESAFRSFVRSSLPRVIFFSLGRSPTVSLSCFSGVYLHSIPRSLALSHISTTITWTATVSLMS